jgi:hypothetical protein
MAMRRGDRNASEEAEPLVRGELADLDAQLGQRLALAHELTSRLVQSQDEIDVLRADFYNWDEYNEQLLRFRFSTNKIANEYKRVTFGIGNAPSSAIELTWLREDIGTQTRKLESIRQKLELFSPRSTQLQTCAHLVGARRSRRSSRRGSWSGAGPVTARSGRSRTSAPRHLAAHRNSRYVLLAARPMTDTGGRAQTGLGASRWPRSQAAGQPAVMAATADRLPGPMPHVWREGKAGYAASGPTAGPAACHGRSGVTSRSPFIPRRDDRRSGGLHPLKDLR